MKAAARTFLYFFMAAAAIGGSSYYAGLFSGIDRFLNDRLFIAREPDERIMILAIDEAALAVFGQWPWPRATFSKIIEGLNELEPAAIAIDISFAEPSRLGEADDNALEAAIKKSKAPIILAAEAAPLKLAPLPRAGASIQPLARFSQNARSGYANVIADPDGVVRSFTPYIENAEGAKMPHFSLEIAKSLEPIMNLPNDQVLRINYAGGPGTFHTASLALKTENRDKFKEFTKGKVIIIGATAQSLQDLKSVPTGDGRQMAGAEIHAHIANMLAEETYILPIASSLGLALIALLAAVPTGSFIFFSRSLIPLSVSFAAIAAYLIAALLLYEKGFIFPLASPLGAWVLALGSSQIYRSFAEEKEKRKIRETFSKYVSNEVLDIILSANEPKMLMGRKTEATILFTDLQGFTKASSNLPPERVIEFLNIYFETMSPIIKRCRGIVDKFIGDAIMAFWCEPFAGGAFADRAVYCAIEMLEAVPKVNLLLKERGLPELIMRIGINTGEIIVGNIGSNDRLDFTVIGNAVNAAARLEPLNKEYGTNLMVSEATYRALTESYPLTLLGTAELRGTTGATVIYGYPKSGVFSEKPTANTKDPTRPEGK